MSYRLPALSTALAFLFAGASAQADSPPVVTPKAAVAPAKAAGNDGDVARRAQAVVTYAGGQVTVGDLEDAIARQSPFMRARYKDPASMKELLEKTLRASLLSDEAGRRGYGGAKLVVQSVKQNAVQQLMKSDFDDKLAADAIAKEEIAKYYQKHLDEYQQPAMQRASHVMVATEEEAKALLVEAKAADLRAFRQLVRDKSIDDATKLRGGDLRYFDTQGKARGETEASVPAPIARAAFTLKDIGDTAAAPVKIPGGYSIVKLTGERPAISRKLPEVEETIRMRLWREKRQAAIEAFVAKLREQQKPETHPELADLIKLSDANAVRGEGIPKDFPTATPKLPAAPGTPKTP